jgi:mannose-6-phosphate isomerase-like protein (cupin superfamily)
MDQAKPEEATGMTDGDARRSGVRIYRAGDAPSLDQSDFGPKSDFGDYPELQDVTRALAEAGPPTTRLLVKQTPDDGGFSLLYLYFKPNFPLFRHKHEDDCMYMVISGTAIMGNQTLHPGDCFFVPAYAPYYYTAGPEGVEVLEIRHNVDRFTTIYTSNPSGRAEEARAAIDANHDAWQQTSTGPLLAANSGE